MPALSFHFHGALVVIKADDPQWLTHYDEYFRAYAPAAGGETTGDLRIELRAASRAKRPAAAQLEKIAQTGIVSLWRSLTESETLWLYAGDTTFEIHPPAGRAMGYLDDAALAMPPILTNTYSLFALLLLLRWRGVYHLHAAAVQLPDGRSCWIAGAQRSGKTTLVTALGLAGWKPLADDSLFLSWQGEQVSWRPMLKAFHLGNDVLERWQARLIGLNAQPRYLDRHSVAALEFFQTTQLAAQSYATVDLVLFPRVQPITRTIIKPLPLSEALRRLAEQSTFFALWKAHSARQWRALLEATATAHCFEMMTGEDVLTTPERVAALFDLTKG
jgi:hypothetical protein